MKPILLSSCLFLLLQSLQAQKTGPKDLLQLRNLMTGSFHSLLQNKADSATGSINLEIRTIWTKRKDGYWLYAEEATTASPAIPYRQKVWHLYPFDDSTLACQLFELKDPGKYAGWWKEPRRFDSVKFQALGNKVGCEWYLRKTKTGSFIGGTDGQDCLSTLPGTSYTTSEVEIGKKEIHIRERFWNADQQPVSETNLVFVRTIRK